jgi:hypothetical protein
MTFLTVKTSRKSAPFRVGYLHLEVALSRPLQPGLRFLRHLLPPQPSPFLTVRIPCDHGVGGAYHVPREYQRMG